MRFAVERDGTTTEIQVDLELGEWTKAERSRLVAALGEDRTAALVRAVTDGNTDELEPLDETMRVMLWAKAATRFPGLPLEAFATDLDEPDSIDVAAIPMEVMRG